MSFFFTKDEDSTGEIIKRLLCTNCEKKIREEIRTGRCFHDMCFEMTDNCSYWAVEKYARTACPLCRLALAILQDEGAPLSVTSDGMPLESAKYSFEYAKFLMPHSVHPIQKSTDSIATFTLSKKWVTECIHKHQKCAMQLDSIMPSRLLEINVPKEKSNCQMRLRTSSIPRGTQYTTLSHVWGSLNFVKLVKDNISDFQKDIPVSTLTKTFHDALKVTLEFGFHYLWIDSLCIIQDDVDDWKKESVRMASIYGGSSLNIAATGARDGNDGLFFDRNPNLIQRVELMTDFDFEWGGSNGYKPKFFLADMNIYKRSCLESPLFQRAWTLQERLLSPRTLHFSKHQVILECHTRTYFETFDQAEDARFGTSSQLKDLHSGNFWYAAWNEIVKLYTRSRLTISSDKLVALSGIAKYFANKYNAQYLSGIWKEHLPSALLWHGERNCRERHLPLRGPTWSWASVDTEIHYFHSRTLHCEDSDWYLGDFKILGIQVDTTPSDPFGHCLGGAIRIACVKVLDSEIFIKDLSTKKPSEVDVHFDNSSHSKVYLLKITNAASGTIWDGAEEGLLITPVAGRKGFFTRIGIYLPKGDLDLVNNVKVLEDARKSLEPLRDDELSLYEGIYGINEAGKRMYTITLI
ncbi:hypothetical protein BCON_0031g00290 [Botryotinia convoluta]|uniref:Heterokaryon incompatibility domain-containing protein n=1 Tax=Botryotinia convoluta TaxID=54673 RepID=A0A4Z1IH99_9HELO|nr:hypothetical protein BCON_0031g00290 [Botryotinia convoluta]